MPGFVVNQSASCDYPTPNKVANGLEYGYGEFVGTLGAAANGGFNGAREAIEAWFQARWEALHPSDVPVQYEANPIKVAPNVDYVALYIRSGEGSQATLGQNGSDRYPGVIIVSIFTEPNYGTANALSLADQVVPIFRGVTIGDTIHCGVPSVQFVSQRDDRIQYNVTIPFYRDKDN